MRGVVCSGGVYGEVLVKHDCLVVLSDPPAMDGPLQPNFILHRARGSKEEAKREQRGAGSPLRPVSSHPHLMGLELTRFPEGASGDGERSWSDEEEQGSWVPQRG